MMTFKSFPRSVAAGTVYNEPKQVLPDQSLSLKEILQRFVRHEALPVGRNMTYGSENYIDPESDSELNIDVEKARYWDMTEKAEFKARVKEYESVHQTNEAKRAKAKATADAKKAELEFNEKVEKRARELAKKPPENGGSI